ncbi:MocR-like transcription factor YczR [Micromonosporaceae bacterium Da 78-11]
MTYAIGAAQLCKWIGEWETHRHAYVDLADAVRLLILDGRLPVGARVPAERVLARELAVSRNTVTAAYRVLREQGYVESSYGSGTFATLPRHGKANNRVTSWAPPRNDDHAIDFTIAASPFPAEMISQATASLGDDLHRFSGGGYDLVGIPQMRQAIADRYTAQGMSTTPEEIMVTAGAQQAWWLLLRLLSQQSDSVLLDTPTYPSAIDVTLTLKRRPLFVGMDRTGWNIELIETITKRHRPAVSYAMPDFHNPTGLVMPAEVRSRLVRAVEREGTYVVFDETMSELGTDESYVSQPTLPFPPSRHAILIGSLSKICWGGLRVGWIRAEPSMVSRLVELRSSVDLGNSLPAQLMAVQLFAVHDELVHHQRTALRTRTRLLTGALRRHLPEWEFAEPKGGLSVWINLGSRVGWQLPRLGAQHGVMVIPGSRFGALGTLEDHLRLPIIYDEPIVEEGVRRLAAAFRQVCN